jgi:hypothetical protein
MMTKVSSFRAPVIGASTLSGAGEARSAPLRGPAEDAFEPQSQVHAALPLQSVDARCDGGTHLAQMAAGLKAVGAAGAETPIQRIALSGPLASKEAEVSAMAWHGDQLVIVPQYPQKLTPNAPSLYTVSRAEVLQALDGEAVALQPRPMAIEPPDFAQMFPGFEGFEAIAFAGNRAFLLVEAAKENKTIGYVVPARVEGNTLVLDHEARQELPPHSGVANLAYEALSVAHDKLLVMGELNAAPANPEAKALLFDLNLNPLGESVMPVLQYRLTDATPADANGRFWVSNYKMDKCEYPVGHDPLSAEHGHGATHAQRARVERLVELEEKDGEVRLSGRPPVHLALDLTRDGRNWEAMALLEGRGFLVMTDSFPETILGFVPALEIK